MQFCLWSARRGVMSCRHRAVSLSDCSPPHYVAAPYAILFSEKSGTFRLPFICDCASDASCR